MKEITAKKVRKLIPELRPDMHKYSRGLCDLMVGSERYPGAAILASRAANVMGAGYVRVYTYSSAAEALRVVQPSAVCVSEAEYIMDTHESSATHPMASVIGCGLTCSALSNNMMAPEVVTTHRVLDALRITKAPVVIDGGGLAALAADEAQEILTTRRHNGYPTIITPHIGEAALLLQASGCAAKTAEELCRGLAQYYQAVCVLKGPDTYIADMGAFTDDDVYIMREGTAALAKAGTGDVLAGLLGSLLAQQLSPLDAARLATFVHARAGVLAQEKYGICATTEHILDLIPEAVRSLGAKGYLAR